MRPMKPLVLFGALLSLTVSACDTGDPTQAVVDNDYPPPDAGAGPQTVVYKTWWVTTLFPDPVSAGQSSDAERAVPAVDYAYAILAPGWDPTSSAPPATLLAVRSKVKLGAARGDTLHIAFSDAAFDGICGAGSSLSQDDADFITTRIFPGDFAGVHYDAATCAAVPVTDGDGGDDGGG